MAVQFAKVSEVKKGDTLIADGGFPCLKEGQECLVSGEEDGTLMSVFCYGDDPDHTSCTNYHFLSGQIEEVEGEKVYVGFTKKDQ